VKLLKILKVTQATTSSFRLFHVEKTNSFKIKIFFLPGIWKDKNGNDRMLNSAVPKMKLSL
jgi:hypothetical protein